MRARRRIVQTTQSVSVKPATFPLKIACGTDYFQINISAVWSTASGLVAARFSKDVVFGGTLLRWKVCCVSQASVRAPSTLSEKNISRFELTSLVLRRHHHPPRLRWAFRIHGGLSIYPRSFLRLTSPVPLFPPHYFSPLAKVTPLELEVALGKREWDGFYSTDFEDLLGSGPQIAPSPRPPPPPSGVDGEMGSLALVDPPPATGGAREAVGGGGGDGGTVSEADNGGGDDDDDEPFFSLVTGTYQNKPGVSRRPPGEATGGGSGVEAAGGGGALVGVGDRSLVEWTSPAADFLGKREFKGLEALVGQTEAKAATEGQSGIASDYGGV